MKQSSMILIRFILAHLKKKIIKKFRKNEKKKPERKRERRKKKYRTSKIECALWY